MIWKRARHDIDARKAVVDVRDDIAGLRKEFAIFADEHKWRESFYEANCKLVHEIEMMQNKIDELQNEIQELKAKLSIYEGK